MRVPKMTVEEHLTIEREAECKSGIFAMAGGTRIHVDLGGLPIRRSTSWVENRSLAREEDYISVVD